MALLKAATWSSVGTEAGQGRLITWGSTSDKVITPEFKFFGRIILLANTIPQGKETDAFLSRCLSYKITFLDLEIRKMLLSAAGSHEHFDDLALSKEVAQFLTNKHLAVDLMQINLRTLRLGYELAMTQPQIWKQLLPLLLPKLKSNVAPQSIDPAIPAREQQSQFQAHTGLSRRSFYYHKRKLGLTRPYRSKASVPSETSVG